MPEPPPGFAATGDVARLIARREHLEELVTLGLQEPAEWTRRLAGGSSGSGRGPTAVVELPSGATRLRLKQMRRGGTLAALWRERYLGVSRLLGNLTLPDEAVLRGIATPAPVALLLQPGPPGFFRAWIAFENLDRAEDLCSVLLSERPPRPHEYTALAELVRRLHERGIEHRDLNLGNLLLERRQEEGARAWVVDLDRARLHAGPVPPRRRRAVLERLLRSYFKEVGADSPTGEGFVRFMSQAARGDEA